MKKGKFVVFEGIDGSGKTTQAKLLVNFLQRSGEKVHFTFEPTKRPIGELIRQIMAGKLDMDEKAIAALFLADRLDHLNNEQDGIIPMIESGVHVICDRYYLSSYAYHSSFVSIDWIMAINSICKESLRPDVTFYLDISAEKSSERIAGSRATFELYENINFLRKVRQNYLSSIQLLSAEENIIRIDGEQDYELISKGIQGAMKELLNNCDDADGGGQLRAVGS